MKAAALVRAGCASLILVATASYMPAPLRRLAYSPRRPRVILGQLRGFLIRDWGVAPMGRRTRSGENANAMATRVALARCPPGRFLPPLAAHQTR
jgi:hypothetical protein